MLGDIVNLASGFPRGMGGAGCTCGAIIGGVMALCILFGRSEPEGKCPEVITTLVKNYVSLDRI